MKFTPLMFWEDMTFVLQLIAKLFKKIFGIEDGDNEEKGE